MNPNHMEMLAVLGTREEIDKLWEDLAKAGWKFSYKGNTGTWLGQPIYDITNKEIKDEEPTK